MKCRNCGSELPEEANFCASCGTKVEHETAPVAETEASPTWFAATQEGDPEPAATTEAPKEVPEEAPATENNSVPPVPVAKKNNVPLIAGIAAAAVAVLIVIITGIVGLFSLIASRPVSDEKAGGMIEEVMCELQNYEYDAAESLLKKIKLKEDSQYTDILAELEEITAAKPKVTRVDTSDYPKVTVTLKTDDGDVNYQKEDFEILCEDSSVESVIKLEKSGKTYQLTYIATEDDGGEDIEDKILFTKYEYVDFYVPFEFVSEYVTDAGISLVTSNVEKYPEISLYLKVVDEYGEPIENLTKESFTVREYLNIHDYLERDVIYAAKVDGKDALNVSLAIDRSDSISDTDMGKIKNATNTFLSKLQFNSGDKAEIVAFDTHVMQMCLFTNNKDNLMNGVNSMYPYGMTACYDAIVRSIQNASTQSGARCVIVFTDGMDNESVNTVDSVISLANAKSVPVYTIGVGRNLEEGDLRRIASSTGGTYHHIDDISAMSRIYEEIYREQKNLYHVKYVSDTSLSQDAERRIVVRVCGNGYKGACDRVYTPITPVVKASHNSRYEVIKADISWEDANRACINKGGHLATITSKEEEDKIIAVAEKSGIGRLWIGGYTTNNQYDEAVGHWVMGEPFVYQNWFSEDEPSRFDNADDEAEFYLMLWKIDGRWSWNDQRNDLINSPFASTYQGKMGYVIEYEE
ncbi:MAG: VWA domain-containing protein [Clostridia bacterium]|nr:VWA domain-containing protein [Clostridia bacterium]